MLNCWVHNRSKIISVFYSIDILGGDDSEDDGSEKDSDEDESDDDDDDDNDEETQEGKTGGNYN